MTARTFPCFIKKTQINPEFFNFSVYQGLDDFCDQSVVCQNISKVSCFLNNTTDISVLIGIFRNSVNSVKVPCFVNLRLVIFYLFIFFFLVNVGGGYKICACQP